MISNETKIKLQDYFLGTKTIEEYIIEKRYLIHDEDRQIFFTKIWNKNLKPHCSLLYCHGLGEHSMRNIDVACRFCD